MVILIYTFFKENNDLQVRLAISEFLHSCSESDIQIYSILFNLIKFNSI